jgi:hypothetical protein
LLCETASGLRAGDLVWEDRGLMDGATITFLKQQRHVDVLVPLQGNLLSSHEAVPVATRQGQGHPHPSRDHQHSAFVQGVEHRWAECPVPLHACVRRSWHRNKDALDHGVLVTTAQRLPGPWIVRHDEERPEIEQADAQRKRGGWALQKLRATRYSEIVFYRITVVVSSSLSPLCRNTQAGSRVAAQPRQALAWAQLRSRRTHGRASAGGYFAIFATWRWAHFMLQLPASAQERWRQWLDEHLSTVQKRE